MPDNETPKPAASDPPPYARTAPMPYTRAAPEQRRIWQTKGNRGIGFGIAWLVGGLALTAFTYSNASQGGGFYLIAWGPMVYGIYRIVAGAVLLRKSRNQN